MKPATRLAMAMLVVVAAAHLLRVLLRVEVIVGGHAVPLWMSGAACLAIGTLVAMMWREVHA